MACLETKIPPPIWMLMHIGLEVAISVPVDDHVLKFTDSDTRSWRTVLAVLIGLASFAIMGAGISLFKRFGTTVSPLTPEESSVLVTSGIYRFTRNPMYVGMVGILIAVAVALGDAVPLLVGPTLYVLIVTRLQIIPEELMLKDIFGDEYVAYCRQTRRWI